MKLTNIEISDKLVKELKTKGININKFVNNLIEDKIRHKLRCIEHAKEQRKSLAKLACKKCKGIKVHSLVTNYAANDWGKRCTCDEA